MHAQTMCAVLNVEDDTVDNSPRTSAALPGHRADPLPTTETMKKHAASQTRDTKAGNEGVRARDHFDALQLMRKGLPGVGSLD